MKRKERHGESKPRSAEYSSWENMIQRCHNKNSRAYKHYGAKGISVCKEWRESFLCFLKDMGRKPSRIYTIERKRNDLGYSLSNCRWATQREQLRNTEQNILLEYDGEILCLSDWANRLKINKATISGRLRRGWSVKKALTEPVVKPARRAPKKSSISFGGKTQSIAAWSRELGVEYSALWHRLQYLPLDQALTPPKYKKS